MNQRQCLQKNNRQFTSASLLSWCPYFSAEGGSCCLPAWESHPLLASVQWLSEVTEARQEGNPVRTHNVLCERASDPAPAPLLTHTPREYCCCWALKANCALGRSAGMRRDEAGSSCDGFVHCLVWRLTRTRFCKITVISRPFYVFFS